MRSTAKNMENTDTAGRPDITPHIATGAVNVNSSGTAVVSVLNARYRRIRSGLYRS